MTALKLSKPIKAHGEDVAELAFREPTGKDLRTCGMPYSMLDRDGAVGLVIDAGAVAKLISALAGIPTSSVDQLSARDFQEATNVIVGFFGPGAAPAASS